jgi:hypothetical protein
MSFKAKDLHFGKPAVCTSRPPTHMGRTDNEQPAFLRRLRGELTSGDTARHEQPIPRNKRLKKDDEDDAPTYVLEDTKESLTKEEYEALVSGKDPKAEDEATVGDKSTEVAQEPDPKQKDKIAEVGAATKKRKAVKIVNEEHDDGSVESNPNPKQKGSQATKKPRKKVKAVKLNFGDEEE